MKGINMKTLITSAVFALGLLTASGWQETSAAEKTEDFGIKAAYVDFRTEVRTLASLKKQAETIAAMGMNAIIMEWEASFPFDRNATLCNRYSFTADEVREFVAYCRELGIEVIPLQNCLGHSEYILRHERYHALREDPKDPSQVCPLKADEAEPVFREIFREVVALHPSKYFHIGADETYLLGKCRECGEFVREHGKSKLFVDYVNRMCRLVLDMGKIPVMWADIILAYPEAIDSLPEEVILVDWNYGWDVNHFGELQNIYDSGVEIWGATSLRSYPDNIYLTQWMKHFTNLATFVPYARAHGYKGMIETSWSTSGIYGFHFDNENEIMNMQPVRLVYPESGFRILNAAAAKAFNMEEPLDPKEFIYDYAVSRFGFDETQAGILWDYFSMPQETVSSRTGEDSEGRKIADVLSDAKNMRDKLLTLRPKDNKEEIRHLQLMLDIRINYLEYKLIETIYESSVYDRSHAAALAEDLDRVCREGKKLDRRFASLNKGYLKPGEIEYICFKRGEKMNSLLEILDNNR